MNHLILSLTAALSLAASFTLLAQAKQPRSASAIAAFKRHTPCPATLARSGSCPGYIIDHIIPLCAGGPDTSANMQWQTRADSLAKDIDERRQCRALKRQGATPR